MPIETAEDRAVYVDPEGFGESIVYRRAAALHKALTLNALVTRPQESLDLGDVAVSGRRMTIHIRRDDLAEAVAGDQVEIGGRTYRVDEPETDSADGFWILGLQ